MQLCVAALNAVNAFLCLFVASTSIIEGTDGDLRREIKDVQRGKWKWNSLGRYTLVFLLIHGFLNAGLMLLPEYTLSTTMQFDESIIQMHVHLFIVCCFSSSKTILRTVLGSLLGWDPCWFKCNVAKELRASYFHHWQLSIYLSDFSLFFLCLFTGF